MKSSFPSRKASKEQLSILSLEMAKPIHEKVSWTELSEILNSEGPTVKSAMQWKQVNIDRKYIL